MCSEFPFEFFNYTHIRTIVQKNVVIPVESLSSDALPSKQNFIFIHKNSNFICNSSRIYFIISTQIQIANNVSYTN